MERLPDSQGKLRIAMFGHRIIPAGSGGVEKVVEQLSVRMAAQGCSVTLYDREAAVQNGRTVRTYKGVKLRYAPGIPIKGVEAASSSFFSALRSAFGPYDVVHIHSEGPAAMCFIPGLAGKKVVVTIHGLDYRRTKWGRFASWFLRAGEKNAVRYADEIVVLSHSMQDYFRSEYGRQTHLIPNGVEPPVFFDGDGASCFPGLNKDGYILFLGRIVPEKGLDCLIDAFMQTKTDKKLVIAGDPADTDAFYAQLKHRAENDERIVFTGAVYGERKAELFSHAYLYVLPSDVEGMPISLLEALSYGCCCLTSDIPECVELLGDCGMTFSAGNMPSLMNALQVLCDSLEKVNEYRKKAASFRRDYYDWDSVTDMTLEVYRQLTEKRSHEDSDGKTLSLSEEHDRSSTIHF